MCRASCFLLVLALLPACRAGSEGGTQPEESAVAGEPMRRALPEPDPDGVTFYPWEDVYAAGRLDWAWAIAIDHGDLRQVERLLADGVDPDVLISGDYQASSAPRKLGRTALMEAAWFGYEELVGRLLAAGADPLLREVSEPQHFSGDTALHKAASRGHAGIVRVLLDAGVGVDLEGQGGLVPLRYAHNDLETFELLLAHGADLEQAGGATLLFDGVISSQATDLAALLLSLGADVEGSAGEHRHGYTPLWSATVGGHQEMVLFLLENGADTNVEPAGSDLVELARERGHQSIAALIERARAGMRLRPPAEDPSQQ